MEIKIRLYNFLLSLLFLIIILWLLKSAYQTTSWFIFLIIIIIIWIYDSISRGEMRDSIKK